MKRGTVVFRVLCEATRDTGQAHVFGKVIRDEDGVLWLRMKRAGANFDRGIPGHPDRVPLTPALGLSYAGCGCRVHVQLDHLRILQDIRKGERVMWL